LIPVYHSVHLSLIKYIYLNTSYSLSIIGCIYFFKLRMSNRFLLDAREVSRVADLEVLQVVLLDVLGEVVHLRTHNKPRYPPGDVIVALKKTTTIRSDSRPTCTELVMVLRANRVAQSLMVDWLSNAPCVSMSRTATCDSDDKSFIPASSKTRQRHHDSGGARPGSAPPADLAAVWFLHHEHLAPGQDARGLALAAAPPAEAGQRLLLASDPRVRLDGDKRRAERSRARTPHSDASLKYRMKRRVDSLSLSPSPSDFILR